MESLQHFERCRNLFLHFRRKETFHSRLHLIDSVVDDGVDSDVHFLGLRHLTSRTRRTDVEADDDSIGRSGEHDIAVADSTDGTVDDVDLDILRGEFDERVLDSLY